MKRLWKLWRAPRPRLDFVVSVCACFYLGAQYQAGDLNGGDFVDLAGLIGLIMIVASLVIITVTVILEAIAWLMVRLSERLRR